ncbi:hypothetical protein B0H15DRAFT_1021326 [Mycena belliarum]|uniref:C2H2-type domain-containing protein n=1 Tax=Mycena belliarum TaxID=1033014 RepID=A0AAD6XSE7_9AGAR|nr:hypothetical protein B0H15DRAFT_1021326 [Mycena belliae]
MAEADGQTQAAEDTPIAEEEDVDGDWDEYDEEEEEEDLDAAARLLQEQLWADIKANTVEAPAPEPPSAVDAPKPLPNSKEHAAVSTVRAILASLQNDTLAQSTFAASKIPEFDNGALLDILNNIADSGKIPRGVALPISRFLVTLANSEVLFGRLRHSDAPSVQLKRKREEADDAEQTAKRLHIESHPLHKEVEEAVRVVSQTITGAQTLDPPLIASIEPQLHRVFLFAVSSSAAGGPSANALQEISGLIQLLGVLSAIQIAAPAPSDAPQTVLTAVHPCLVSGCGKFFARLYSLRAHQRVHSEARPFRCSVCPATFARNHDLRRHRQLHERAAFRCAGCAKVFSRRDAIKRHQTPTKTRHPRAECAQAQIVEVEATEAAARATNAWAGPAPDDEEEGEIERGVVLRAQGTVLGLHALLQAHVARAVGAPAGQQARALPSAMGNGQATLASVIARAQARQASDAPLSGNAQAAAVTSQGPTPVGDATSLSMYGLSDEQTKQLEEAIANAASAAQAEAEAQAALEEEEEDAEAEDDESDAPADVQQPSHSTPN